MRWSGLAGVGGGGDPLRAQLASARARWQRGRFLRPAQRQVPQRPMPRPAQAANLVPAAQLGELERRQQLYAQAIAQAPPMAQAAVQRLSPTADPMSAAMLQQQAAQQAEQQMIEQALATNGAMGGVGSAYTGRMQHGLPVEPHTAILERLLPYA